MDQAILTEISDIVGGENLITAPEERLAYGFDGSGLEAEPAAVVFPGSTEETAAVLAIAHRHGLPVTVRGAGTGMTGGAVPAAGGLVLATSRLNRIIHIDTANHLAEVEPGVLNGDLKAAAAACGLFYPPDPASYAFSTLGGNLAENAGGPMAVKYGVSRDYVRALTVVLADGRILHTGQRTAKGVVGYDLTRLFVGSEGTLGVITRMVLRLVPMPESRATLLVLTDTMVTAVGLVTGILGRITPCTLEYMDGTAIGLVRDRLPFPLPATAGGLLLLEVDGETEVVGLRAQRLAEFCRQQPGVLAVHRAADAGEADTLWQARRALSPAAFALGPHKKSEDVVVPRDRIPELVTFTAGLAKELELAIFTFGHAGDGNIHVNIMHDRNRPGEAQRVATARRRIFRRTLELGGTISGEHGIGLTKAPFLELELDPVRLAVHKAIKQALDPTGILNPGKIFPS